MIVKLAQQSVQEKRLPALDAAHPTLHVRCGTDIMHKLASAGFNGDFLCFCDPYIFGPVPKAGSLDEFVRIRAQGLDVAFQELFTMYEDLDQAAHYPAVMLWFEYDVFDQLILAKLLDFFSDPSHRPQRLQFISTTHFPGMPIFNGIGDLPAEAMRVLWSDFRAVAEKELQAGKEAWNAITDATPTTLFNLVSSDAPALPVMRRALRRHLQELPAVTNGLGRSEQTTLRILADEGPMSAARLYGWFQNHYDPMTGMGDRFFAALLQSLANAAEPAITLTRHSDAPTDWHVELRPFGVELLRNNADWLSQNHVQRWVGGVFVDSGAETHWRLDDARNEVVQTKRSWRGAVHR